MDNPRLRDPREVPFYVFSVLVNLLMGFWPTVAQLPQSHPFTVRRLETLHDAGFFEAPAHDPASGVVPAES